MKLYAPVETNICTAFELKNIDPHWRTIPIGRPTADAVVTLREPKGEVVPAGQVGELWVRGACTTGGYWGDPELTAQAYIEDDGHRWLRTGDLAQCDTAGLLHLHGRLGQTVTSRGFRVELAHLEHTLSNHPDVSQSAVVAVPHLKHGHLLNGWIVPGDTGDTGDKRVDLIALRRFLAQQLPSYMMPQSLQTIRQLPLTSTGKVSRRALQASLMGVERPIHPRPYPHLKRH